MPLPHSIQTTEKGRLLNPGVNSMGNVYSRNGRPYSLIRQFMEKVIVLQIKEEDVGILRNFNRQDEDA